MFRTRHLIAALTTLSAVVAPSPAAHAATIDGEGLHCETVEIRHGVVAEGCAAVGRYPDGSYVWGMGEASIEARRFRVRIASVEIWVDGARADARACPCSPEAAMTSASRFATPGSTAQAAVTYEVWVLRGKTLRQLGGLHRVESDVVATPSLG